MKYLITLYLLLMVSLARSQNDWKVSIKMCSYSTSSKPAICVNIGKKKLIEDWPDSILVSDYHTNGKLKKRYNAKYCASCDSLYHFSKIEGFDFDLTVAFCGYSLAEHGNYFKYHANGNLFLKAFFNEGKSIGTWHEYDSTGYLVKTTSYDERPNGPYREYYPDGRVKIEGQYTAGNKSGNWIYYDTLGNKTISENYIDDMLFGEYLEFYPNGFIKTRGNFGIFKSKAVQTFHPKTFHEVYMLTQESMKDGTWEQYDDVGNTLETKYYETGHYKELILSTLLYLF